MPTLSDYSSARKSAGKGRLSAPEQNTLLGIFADLLRGREETQTKMSPTMTGTIMDLLLPSAETVEKLSYGDPVFRMPPSGTGGYVPLTTDKKYAAEVGGILPAASMGTTRLANEAADRMVRAITKNPEATAPAVLEEAARMVPLASIGKLKGIPINELLYPGKTIKELTSAEKSAITKFERDLKVQAVRRREEMRLGGETIATPTPGLNMASEISFNPEKLVGKRLVPVFGDTSGIGKDVSQIRGVPLSKPVTQQGGFQYPLVQSNLNEEIAYASEPTAAANKIANFNKFPEEDVLAVFLAGGPRSIDFSHHQAQALVRQLDAIQPSDAAVKNFNQALQNYAVPKKDKEGKAFNTYPFKNLKTSITSPEMEVLMAERTSKDFTPGQLRTAISDLMEKYEFRKQGFPVYNDALEVMTDPRLQQGFMGQTIFEAIPSRGIQTPTYTHQSYSAGIPGRYVGGLQGQTGELTGAPAELLFPKLFAEKQAKGATRSNVLTSMLKAHQGEVFTEEALDPLMQFLSRQ